MDLVLALDQLYTVLFILDYIYTENGCIVVSYTKDYQTKDVILKRRIREAVTPV